MGREEWSVGIREKRTTPEFIHEEPGERRGAASRRLPGSTTSAHGFSLRPFTTYVNENASAYDERECYALRAYIHSDCERRMTAASAFAKFLSYPPGFVDS